MMSRTISYEQYRNTVLAGWLGKSLGGVIGAPLENHKQYHNLTLDTIWPDEIGANDDLDIQMIWLEAMEDFGVFLDSDDLARIWQDRCFYNYLDYGYFLYNLQRGINPPLSGTWNNHFFPESEGCPIRSEIWGYVCPGNMRLAAQLARNDGQLDHGGLSVEIEMFQSAIAAESFFCNDFDKLLQDALVVLPESSIIPSVIKRVREIVAQYPNHRQAWQVLIREFGNRDASKAITNFAIVLVAMFMGKGDFKKVILYCVNSGWDVDCTAATAGAFMGTIYGLDALPQDWLARLSTKLVSNLKRKFDDVEMSEVAEATCKVGVEMTALRSPDVRITDAPEVELRDAPVPEVTIMEDYPEQPVLWAKRQTKVNLTIDNPLENPVKGKLEIVSPQGVSCEPSEVDLKLDAKGGTAITLTIQRATDDQWIDDKNLFTAKLTDGPNTLSERTFGLTGARQWQVYGPYWEMWDRTKYGICPFHNDERKCPPGVAGCGSDSYNNYARLDHEYLDEARLLTEDLPDEVPLILEAPEDWITEEHLGGFVGQGCYYFVRTFKTPKDLESAGFSVGRTGPFRAWLNGQQIGQQTDTKAWTPWEQENAMGMKFTSPTQRLVVKVIRESESMVFSTHFFGQGDPQRKRGISWFSDSFSDQIV